MHAVMLKTPALQFSSVPDYLDDDVRRWGAGDYSLLDTPDLSPFIRDILRERVTTRQAGRLDRGQQGDRRFFGEAYIASQIGHDEGFYGSFKWLTSSACVDGTRRAEGFSRAYGAALRQNFGDHLAALRERARLLVEHGVKPMPPDLWLIRGGTHRFIESKLRGDTVRDPQLAGLAVIASCLSGVVPLAVEVVRAFSQSEPRKPAREQSENRRMLERFEELRSVLDNG